MKMIKSKRKFRMWEHLSSACCSNVLVACQMLRQANFYVWSYFLYQRWQNFNFYLKNIIKYSVIISQNIFLHINHCFHVRNMRAVISHSDMRFYSNQCESFESTKLINAGLIIACIITSGIKLNLVFWII